MCLVYPLEFDSASFNQTFGNEKDCYKINSLGPYRSPQKVDNMMCYQRSAPN